MSEDKEDKVSTGSLFWRSGVQVMWRVACRAFAVAALLRALVSREALTLEGALGVDAVTVRTQPVLTLVDVCEHTTPR